MHSANLQIIPHFTALKTEWHTPAIAARAGGAGAVSGQPPHYHSSLRQRPNSHAAGLQRGAKTQSRAGDDRRTQPQESSNTQKHSAASSIDTFQGCTLFVISLFLNRRNGLQSLYTWQNAYRKRQRHRRRGHYRHQRHHGPHPSMGSSRTSSFGARASTTSRISTSTFRATSLL